MEITVLYEDNHIIAVYKPAGVLVMKGEQEGHDDNTLYWQVKEFIKRRDAKPGNVFLGVLHRLDRPVAGIVLFAKTSKGAARLSEQFRNDDIEKIYHAVVVGQPKPASATLRHFLMKNEAARKATIAQSGDESVLYYQTIKTGLENSLLRIRLETGRYHQIRAQLSAIDHPIVGDVKYGAPKQLLDGSIGLCATEVSFRTATTGEQKTITLEIPQAWSAWL